MQDVVAAARLYQRQHGWSVTRRSQDDRRRRSWRTAARPPRPRRPRSRRRPARRRAWSSRGRARENGPSLSRPWSARAVACVAASSKATTVAVSFLQARWVGRRSRSRRSGARSRRPRARARARPTPMAGASGRAGSPPAGRPVRTGRGGRSCRGSAFGLAELPEEQDDDREQCRQGQRPGDGGEEDPPPAHPPAARSSLPPRRCLLQCPLQVEPEIIGVPSSPTDSRSRPGVIPGRCAPLDRRAGAEALPVCSISESSS